MRKLQNQRIKKRGKIAAILLSVLCCLTMVVGQGQVVKGAVVIDTTKTDCSITIHKYEYNGDVSDPQYQGTGDETTDNGKVPSGAKPLSDVEFTIYMVENSTKIEDYYAANSTTTLEAGTYYETSADPKVKYQIKPAYSTVTKFTASTNAAGVVKFENLPVGVYLVIETKVPDKVTTPVTPFLVTVPVVNPTGDDWNYDVHVYPKNKTTYAGVKLKKTGNGNPLGGVNFVLQKKQADGKYQTITTNDKGENINGIDATGTLTTSSDASNKGIITITDLSPGDYRFIETGIGNNYGFIMDGAAAYTFTIKSDGTVDYGTTATSTDGLTTYILVDNKKPDVEKKVWKNGTTNDYVKEADYSVGDTISYRIKVDVPSNIESLRKFEVKDAPTNIVYKADTLKVYKDEAKTSEITAGLSITNGTPSNGFTLTFDTTVANGIKDSAGSSIYIFYDAVLQDGAVQIPDTTVKGNSNTVTLTYENKINPVNGTDDGNPNPTRAADDSDITTYPIEDRTVVYTFKMTIEKKGEGDALLSGVKFNLYKEDTNGTITGDAAKALGLDSGKTWKLIQADLTTVDGKISPTEGLGNGIYYLVETETKDGYNLLSKPVKVELKAGYITKFSDTASVSDTGTKKNEVVIADSTMTEKMSVDDTDQDSLTVTIKNSKGFTLPQTGGAGGFLLTVIGCGVMILGIVLFHKSRDNKKEEAA